MGKRSDFKRIEKDQYQTIDPKAVDTLIKYLDTDSSFYEPCVGKGFLQSQLVDKKFTCLGFSDLELDATTHTYNTEADLFITNPPWTRAILHPLILNLCNQKPTWLLFDADWMHTKQAKPYIEYLKLIVSVGRLKWIEGTNMTGKDNCCWYLFDKDKSGWPSFVN